MRVAVNGVLVRCLPKRDCRDKPGDDVRDCATTDHNVMAGHSHPKDGVLSHAYVPAISLREILPYDRRACTKKSCAADCGRYCDRRAGPRNRRA